MPKLTLKDWLYAQHVPPEVMADIEKLFALPKHLTGTSCVRCHHTKCLANRSLAGKLEAILGIEQSKR